MRKLYVSVLAVMACLASFAQTKFTASVTNGSWDIASNWTVNGTTSTVIPSDNAVIEIPAGRNITVSVNKTLNNVQLLIQGTLTISGNTSGNPTVLTLTNSGVRLDPSPALITRQNSQQMWVNGQQLTFSGKDIIGLATFGNYTLPVKFAGFSVARQNSDVLVQWSTAEEANALAFEVERSTDGNTWSRIASVPARGNSSSLTTYTYSDKNVTAAVAYYRIRQVDIDGKSMYTSIQSVKSAAATGDVKVAAISNRLVLQFPVQVKGAVEARVMTLSGQVVSKQVLQQPVGQVFLNTPSVKGAYIISVSNGQEINVAKQVVL